MEAQPVRDKQSIQHLYNTILPELAKHIHQNLSAVIPLFHDFHLERIIDTWTKDPDASYGTEVSVENGNVQQVGLRLRLEGFERPGADNFDISKDLLFKLERGSYTVGPDKHNIWLEKEYLQRWEKPEYQEVAGKWIEELIDAITQRLENFTG
ncbi:hypothetical protein [Pontibacter roseus]|uniref:hypothetical protein n=1 Tax=Pontibacter roseus TaxID=336989 RepID=UPI000361B76A|nr:hypothetical protein [Pontibacter roseus]